MDVGDSYDYYGANDRTSQMSHSTDYSPEDDINTINKMPCDIVKIVFWIIFYKIEYKLNFSNGTLFVLVCLALFTLIF